MNLHEGDKMEAQGTVPFNKIKLQNLRFNRKSQRQPGIGETRQGSREEAGFAVCLGRLLQMCLL